MASSKSLILLSILSFAVSDIDLLSVEAVDVCPPCVSFADTSLDALYADVTGNVIPNSCADLCGILGQNLASQVCGFFCLDVGLSQFIKFIKQAKPDPIYFCELLDACPVVDGGAANITTTYIIPSTGPQYTTFNIQTLFQVSKPTGTGQIKLTLKPPGTSVPVTQAYLNEGFEIGAFSVKFQVATDSLYPAGNYTGTVAVCSGTCGADSPNSAVLSATNIKFTLTSKP